ILLLSTALGIGLLSSCGGDSTGTSSVATSTARGTLAINPPFLIASLQAADLTAHLASTTVGAQLLLVTGNPTCGVDFYHVEFWTVGGAGETTESSGPMLGPSGSTTPLG